MKPLSKVIFFPTRSPHLKLERIARTAHQSFNQREPLLFLTADDHSNRFLDTFLWKSPTESFLPHPSSLLKISSQLDPAYPFVFNLTLEPILNVHVKTIYELEDHTTPEKLALSQKRYHLYKDEKFQIIVEF